MTLARMETLAWCKAHRAKIYKVLNGRDGDLSLPKKCTKQQRCKSGFCPKCIRVLRKEAAAFADEESLHKLDWRFVSFRPDGWDMLPGDCSAFGKLRDHNIIKGMIRNLSRQQGDPLLVFGSIETVLITIDNVQVMKPFHVHLLVSGRSEDQIREAIGKRVTRTVGQPFPVDIRKVGPTAKDFHNVLSYCLKQPFWKKSKRHATDKGKAQFPKAKELHELASNYGVHGWSGRLILNCIRLEASSFKFTADLSST